MALSEHVLLDKIYQILHLNTIKQYWDVLKDNGGVIVGLEYWGLRTLI